MAAATPSMMTLLGTGTSMGVPMIGCRCPVCTSTNPLNSRTRTGVYISAPEGPPDPKKTSNESSSSMSTNSWAVSAGT